MIRCLCERDSQVGLICTNTKCDKYSYPINRDVDCLECQNFTIDESSELHSSKGLTFDDFGDEEDD